MDDVTVPVKSNVNMEELFKTVAEVRGLIETISSQAEAVVRRHGAILSAPNPQQRKKDELEKLNNEIKKNVHFVWAKLKSMQASLPVDENSNSASVNQRIQKNQHSHLTRWFMEVLRGYYNAQISFRERCKAQIQRQLEIVDKVPTDEELEEMLHSDSPAIFTSDIISGTQIPRQALNEIESRHQDIVRLESSIRELHEMFADIAMLVETQGELMNSIEKNLTSAAEYVDTGKADTKNAVLYMKNTHRVMPLLSFFNLFKSSTAAKTAAGQNPSDLKP
uniref:syntaxin-2-like n=1 Tax=Centroberyx gerrardi TaxID=166262 RepID=UPI003AB01C61